MLSKLKRSGFPETPLLTKPPQTAWWVSLGKVEQLVWSRSTATSLCFGKSTITHLKIWYINRCCFSEQAYNVLNSINKQQQQNPSTSSLFIQLKHKEETPIFNLEKNWISNLDFSDRFKIFDMQPFVSQSHLIVNKYFVFYNIYQWLQPTLNMRI